MSYIIKKFSNGTHYILVDKTIVANFEDRRVICKLNGTIEFHCAFNFSKTEGYYIYVNRSTLKKLKLTSGDVVSTIFKKDTSKYQFEMPEEFEEVLRTDQKASKIFHSLTPGNQRGIIHLITKIKSTEKRIQKSLLFSKKLKMGITSPRELVKR